MIGEQIEDIYVVGFVDENDEGISEFVAVMDYLSLKTKKGIIKIEAAEQYSIERNYFI